MRLKSIPFYGGAVRGYYEPGFGALNTDAKTLFLEWLNDFNPFLYQKAFGFHGMSQVTDNPQSDRAWWQDVATSISAALPLFANAYSQKKLIDIQLQRAQKGLPPLDVSNITAPTKIEVQTPGFDAGKIALYGGGFLALILIGKELLKGR